jgi:hypothetical protein
MLCPRKAGKTFPYGQGYILFRLVPNLSVNDVEHVYGSKKVYLELESESHVAHWSSPKNVDVPRMSYCRRSLPPERTHVATRSAAPNNGASVWRYHMSEHP